MRTISGLLVIGGLSLGCTDNSVPIDQLASKLAAALCSQQVTCGKMPDVASCEAAIETNDTVFMTVVAAVHANTVKYDAGQAGACVDYEASISCSFQGTSLQANPCTKVFTGTVALGGACTITEECVGDTDASAGCAQNDVNCDPTTTCCAGTCTANTSTNLQAGQNCSDSGQCASNLYCGPAGQCKAVVTTEGGACDAIGYGCANPMYCNGDPTVKPFAGTCTTAATSNATCNPKDLLPCADGRDYCDTGTMKCTRNALPNAVCDDTGTGNGAQCVGYADCTNGTCVERLKANAACTTTGAACLGDLQCATSTCVLPPAGMTCM